MFVTVSSAAEKDLNELQLFWQQRDAEYANQLCGEIEEKVLALRENAHLFKCATT